MKIDVNEFLVMKKLSFLAAASSGVLFKAKNDERILTNEDPLLPLPRVTWNM